MIQSTNLRGCIPALLFAILLTSCQTDTTQEQQTEPELPEDELAIEDPWVRPTSPGDSTMLYMTVANGRSEADTLLGVRAPIFGETQIYAASTDTTATSQARPDSVLVIPPQARTRLRPEGSHLVLRNFNQSLSEGGTLLVTVEFAQSGLRQVQARVRTSAPSSEQ